MVTYRYLDAKQIINTAIMFILLSSLSVSNFVENGVVLIFYKFCLKQYRHVTKN